MSSDNCYLFPFPPNKRIENEEKIETDNCVTLDNKKKGMKDERSKRKRDDKNMYNER